jgi:small subunit ribosomal protein S21
VLAGSEESDGGARPCAARRTLICCDPFNRALFEALESISDAPRDAFFVFLRDCQLNQNERDDHMKVIVQNNQIEKAIRDLKKKLTKEGFFSEIKERRFYDKPSVQRKKKQAKAAKRRRKRMRKYP